MSDRRKYFSKRRIRTFSIEYYWIFPTTSNNSKGFTSLNQKLENRKCHSKISHQTNGVILTENFAWKLLMVYITECLTTSKTVSISSQLHNESWKCNKILTSRKIRRFDMIARETNIQHVKITWMQESLGHHAAFNHGQTMHILYAESKYEVIKELNQWKQQFNLCKRINERQIWQSATTT